MALCRCLSSCLQSNISKITTVLLTKQVFLCPVKVKVLSDRGIRPMYPTFLRTMKRRRKLAGPDRIRKRSEYQEWNYSAEIYCFAKRLNEEITENTLKMAFMHQSYIDEEEKKRKDVGVPSQDVQVNLVPNTSLIPLGEKIMSNYIKGFIRQSYEMLPEEGVSAVHDYLMSNEVLSHVSSNLGTKDLILSVEYPPEKETLSTTLKAIVGAVATDRNEKFAELFVEDFVCTQLIGKDLFEIWDIPNPNSVLDSLLKMHDKDPYEARLVFESGRNTIEAIYQVALYSNKVFLGKGPGETLVIAEEMAAYDALRRLFHLDINIKPLKFGKNRVDLKSDVYNEHKYLSQWHDKKFQENKNMAS